LETFAKSARAGSIASGSTDRKQRSPNARPRKSSQSSRHVGSSWLLWRSDCPHNPKVAGSKPAPATINDEGLADANAATLSFTQESPQEVALSARLQHATLPATRWALVRCRKPLHRSPRLVDGLGRLALSGVAVSVASQALGPPLGRIAGHGAHVRGNGELQELQVS